MEQISITVLAVAMALFVSPLFLDLAISIAGNAAASLRIGRQKAGKNAVQAAAIELAVVIPAHNEEATIEAVLKSLRASDAQTPLYVVAHNCTDATAELAANAGARVLVLNNPRLRGKGAALRHGFCSAIAGGAGAVLVVDADSRVSANLIEATRRRLALGASATQCRYELAANAGRPFGPEARLSALAFRGMNVLRARGRAALGFSTGIFGNGFAVTAAALERIPFEADSIAEDVEYHTQLVAAGLRVEWAGEAWVHGEPPRGREARASQEARWEGGRMRVARRTTGRLVSAVFAGRWRAAETLADVWSLPLSRGAIALVLAAGLPVHWLHWFALACGLVTLLYVIQAAALGEDPARDLAALAWAPLYLFWKALITPLVLRQSRGRAEWARTKREAPQP